MGSKSRKKYKGKVENNPVEDWEKQLNIQYHDLVSGGEGRNITIAGKVNVLDFGATGDGKTDNTAAFQKALDTVGKNAIGGTVFVPQGNYLFAGHLHIPSNVTLEGIWQIPTAWTQFKGTTLLVTGGQGSPDGTPFITLGANSLITGVTIYYANQINENPPRPYPWTIASTGGDNASIINVLIVNPYQAVDFGTKPSGRHFIRNLYGQPLYKGLFIDQCGDVGRVENVHFWPFWILPPGPMEVGVGDVTEFIATSGTAFIFGRTDWQYVLNTFSWGYNVGYHFIRTEHGVANGNFLGIGADATNIAVKVDDAAEFGLLITNGQFVSFFGDEPTSIVVGPTNTGVIQFQNSSFWGPAHQIASIQGEGLVKFNNCNFQVWDHKAKGVPAIEVSGGRLLVTSSNFALPKHHIRLNPGVENAVITGNSFVGTPRITNNSQGDVQIGLNAGW